MLVFSLLFLTITITGCGGSTRKGWTATVPVKGKVTYKGEPVAEAQVTFHPASTGGGSEIPGAFALTDAQGNFVLRTFGDADGAAPGEFVVLVTKTIDENAPAPGTGTKSGGPRKEPKFKSLLPGFLGDAKTSPLRVTIASGGKTLEIALGDDAGSCTIK
jgi:hypothetical protein